jgi:dihydrofolate reductase
MVVATDKNLVIGNENKIPWRLKSDLTRLKDLTKGHTVILGRKTYDSMLWYYDKSGREMPGSTYLVVTHNPGYKPARTNAKAVYSIDGALETAKTIGDDDVYVIGGRILFEELLPFTDRIYWTKVDTEAAGDAYFPGLDLDKWREKSTEHFAKDEKNDFDYDLVILERR